MVGQTVLVQRILEVFMFRYPALILLASFSVLALGCAEPVVQTASVTVQVDEDADFTAYQTFSVITSDIVDPDDLPELTDDQIAFNDMVNELIVEAMQAEPVCMTFIPPEGVTEENKPDLWAANGLGQTTDGGYYYECQGAWWWGYWGWYWNPCAYWYPVYVEYDVGNLLILAGPPPVADEEPAPVFAGLAQSVAGTGPDVETKVRTAVQQIFAQWPDQRSCPAPQ
jgi:hypothetical protein